MALATLQQLYEALSNESAGSGTGEDNVYRSTALTDPSQQRLASILGGPNSGWTAERLNLLGNQYLGRDILTDADLDQASELARQSIAGQSPGTRDATGIFSVPKDKPWYQDPGVIIPALALGGTAAGALGAFGGAGGAAAGGGEAAALAGGLTPEEWAASGIFGAPESLAGGLTGAEWGASGIFGAPETGAAAAGAGGAAAAGAAGGAGASRSLIPGIPDNVLAGIGMGGFGYLGAQQQADAFRDVANQNLAIGAPYRETLEQSYKPGFDLLSQPGYGDALQRTADISARAANVTYGNPYDASAQGKIMNDVYGQNYLPALANYRGQLGQFGGLGLNTAGAAQLGGASTADEGMAAIAGGAGRIFGGATMPSYEDLLRQVGQSPYSLNIGGYRR